MTWQTVLGLILCGWAVAAALGLLQLTFDALAADARGARLPARSILLALRNPVRVGVGFTCVALLSPIFHAVSESWNLGFTLFSYDLSAYSGNVKEAAAFAGVGICSAIVFNFVDRLLDQLFPNY